MVIQPVARHYTSGATSEFVITLVMIFLNHISYCKTDFFNPAVVLNSIQLSSLVSV
jgi:hypothetical protein